MVLASPAPREPIHTRRIVIEGYRRADGLFDIEATLSDTKAYDFTLNDRGTLRPGENIHGMQMRWTLTDAYEIVAVEAAMNDTPYGMCPQVAPNFERLVGLRIGRGFLKEAAGRVAGPEGCVHLRELIQQMATVCFQTISPLQKTFGTPEAGRGLVNTCYAHASTSPLVKRRWPSLYTGPDTTD
jgi:hypothetical protein